LWWPPDIFVGRIEVDALVIQRSAGCVFVAGCATQEV